MICSCSLIMDWWNHWIEARIIIYPFCNYRLIKQKHSSIDLCIKLMHRKLAYRIWHRLSCGEIQVGAGFFGSPFDESSMVINWISLIFSGLIEIFHFQNQVDSIAMHRNYLPSKTDMRSRCYLDRCGNWIYLRFFLNEMKFMKNELISDSMFTFRHLKRQSRTWWHSAIISVRNSCHFDCIKWVCIFVWAQSATE